MQTAAVIAQGVLAMMYRLQASGRGLVFVQKLAHGHLLAEHLECDFYRGSTDQNLTDTMRSKMVERWFDGTNKIMVVTDAFGPGNDYPCVRHVWIIGVPRGVVDLVQMAGRGGV